MELQLLILSPDEKVLGFLNPDIVDITEINSYQGLKQITITHPLNDDGEDDYDTLLKHGNKIWRNLTGDGDACLYIINSEKEKDVDSVTVNAEEVLVELNNCGIVENSSTTEITVNSTQLTTWFGNWFTIGTVETPASSKITFTGTLTRMMLLRLIEEKLNRVFVTRYEKDENSNIIHRYLDLKESLGVEHTVPIEIGENTDRIEISINEDDTYRSIVPIIKGNERSGSTENTIKTSTIMNDFKNLTVNVGQSIPMIIEKKEDGTINYAAYWNAPFKKDAGSYQVYLAEPYPASYNNVHNKEGSSTVSRKMGTVETSETDKYAIYNICALKLMDKKDPIVEIEADVHDLWELPGGDIPYNVGDIVHIRLPDREGLITSRVEKTKKNPRLLGGSQITIGNAISGGTHSKSDISRPAGIDSYTLSQIFGEISNVSESIPGVADGRINSLCPGIANTRINALVPGLITAAIAGLIDADEFVVEYQAGRITLSNGICMEWGAVSAVTTAAGTPVSVEVSFTRTFSTAPAVMITPYGLNTLYNSFWGLGNSTTTGFSATNVAATAGTRNARWFAIGKRSGY